VRNQRRRLGTAFVAAACGGAVVCLSWNLTQPSGTAIHLSTADAQQMESMAPSGAQGSAATPRTASGDSVFANNDFSGFAPRGRFVASRNERNEAAHQANGRQDVATKKRHRTAELTANSGISRRGAEENAPETSEIGMPPAHGSDVSTRLPPRPLERSTPSTMELRKREDLAFHFDPVQFPNGLRIANISGDPAVISFHGPAAGSITVNGVQAQENVDYSMGQGLDIQGPVQVGVHIRSGAGTTPTGPSGNG